MRAAERPIDPAGTGWPARLHVVTGKGGTGKTTVAAALALALAADGRRTLLIEVEGRQGIAQLFDLDPLPYQERRDRRRRPRRRRGARAGGGRRGGAAGVPRHVLQAGRGRPGAAQARRDRLRHHDRARACATCCSPARSRRRSPAPSTARRVYDAVVLDAPPTGRIGRFLNVTAETARLAKIGPDQDPERGRRRAAALADDRGARGDPAGGDAGPGDRGRDRRADRARHPGRHGHRQRRPAAAARRRQGHPGRAAARAGRRRPAGRPGRPWPGWPPRRGRT